jgi:putative flippase GtrA
MNHSPASQTHEAAAHKPDSLWPIAPWLVWGWHGLFVPGHSAYQFFRFCVIGSIGVVVNAAIMYLCYDLVGLHYILASVAAFFVASMNNFLLNKKFTFQDQDYSLATLVKQYLKFLSVTLIGLGINLGVLAILVEFFGLYATAANLVGVLFATVSNFLGNKFFAFKQPS